MLGNLMNSNFNKFDFTVENRFLQSIRNIPQELRDKKTWLYSMKPYKRSATKEEIENSKYKNIKLTTKENDNPFKQYITEKGKNPCNINGVKASYTDKSIWKSFDEVTRYNPLGLYHSFQLNNEYICFDFDNAYGDDWNIYNWAQLFLNKFKKHICYIEKSVSGKGLHVLFKNNTNMKNLSTSIKANDLHYNYCSMPDKCKIEVFTNRPIILTGDVINNPVEICNTEKEIIELINFLGDIKKKPRKAHKDIKQFNKTYSKSTNDNDVFDYIKFNVSLEKVFEYYKVDIKNKNIHCPLPEHNENNPSFRADFSLNLWKCFSCNKGGSVIDFVMEIEKIDNPLTAAKRINEIFNLKLDFDFEVNPDFKRVDWDKDFVFVTYKDVEEGKKTIRLSEYNYKFKDDEEPPKMEKFNILQVKENIIRLLNHYNFDMKFNVVKDSYDVFNDNKFYGVSLESFSTDFKDMGMKHNIKMTKENIIDVLKRIAIEKKYNPIEEYLKESHKYYLNNPDDDIFKKVSETLVSESKYKDKFLSKFLLEMVWLICTDDDSRLAGQYMLVLQGEQGIGKTTWLENLLPKKFRSNYFLGGRVLDPNNKDHIIETIDNWLVEMGEIASTFKKADQENLKNFITSRNDKFRRPYDKEAINKKRRTTLCGTTNDNEYLRDLTGSRRFLTLNCIDTNWKKLDALDIDMLWGFIYDKYLKGASYAFTHEEEKQIMDYNQQYVNKPESLLLLEELFILNPEIDEGDNWYTSKEIYNKLGDQFIIPTHFKLGKELKRFGVRIKRSSKKGNLFNVRCKSGGV